MKKLKKIFIIGLSFCVLGGTVFGLYSALQSDLFMVNGVEIEGSMENSPLSREDVMKLAGVPLGRVSLFSLDLKKIENRLLAHEWIKHVRLIKKPKHTLNIFLTFRQPVAFIQNHKGTLSYVDLDGKVFGSYQPAHSYDLPLLLGFNHQDSLQLREALKIYSEWQSHQVSQAASLSSISWDSSRGYRLLVNYAVSIQKSKDSGGGRPRFARTMVDLGAEVDSALDSKFERLLNVFQYLGQHSIAVRQVWTDLGKKVVVKTVSDS